jgi:glutathione S-transferase
MHYTPFVAVLSLLLFFAFTAFVGRARGKYGVHAPATTGHADFERVFRVQQNTLEQMMLFLPALWIFGSTISDPWAAGLGVLWIAGRVLYAQGYYKEASARGKGFLLSIGATGILLIGSLVKSVMILL